MRLRPINRSVLPGLTLPVVVIFILCFCCNFFSFAQNRYILDQKEALQLKVAKQIFQKGQQLFLKKNFNKAENSFKECLKKFPKFSRAYYYLSQIYYDRDDLAKALEHIQKAKESYKFVAELDVATQLQYFELLREQKMNLENEIQEMESMQRTSYNTVKNKAQQSEVSSRIASHRNSIKKIEDRLKTPIVEAKETPAEYCYVHGNILFKLKKYQEALDQYLKTVEIYPGHGSAYNNLANLYYMGKRYKQALYYLAKAEGCGFNVNPKFRDAIQRALSK